MKKILLSVFTFLLFVFCLSFYSCKKEPQRGNLLKVIRPTGPTVLGYYPEMGQWDIGASYPAIEWLVTMGPDRVLMPFLAESVKEDPKNLTMTFKLRKGVKFHDGSDLDSSVMEWNFKMLLDGKKVRFGDLIKSIEIVDNYTMTLHLKEYNNQMLFGYGFTPMFSKVAFEKNGKEWCRTHPVGTGPFELEEFKRDVSLKWKKFANYWQKGKPYLDGIEVRFVPDPVTASAIFEAKEADIWFESPVKYQAELLKKGYKRYSSWPALPIIIYLNTAKEGIPTANKKVREAIEYSLNRPVMAKALGFGLYTPLKMVTPDTEWGYDPDYKGRPYDPVMAKKLLAEAGYPNGLKLKLLAPAQGGGRNDVAESIKAYMDQGGFIVDVDAADPGRFYGSLFGTGWDDMILFLSGLDENYLATAETWFGHSPLTNIASFKRPPEFLDLCREASKYTDKADQKKATEKIVRMISDEALMIPLWCEPAAVMYHPWLHSTYGKNGFIHWASYDDWMEKH